MNLARILRDRLAERTTFKRSRDWLLSLYDRALHRWKNAPLPGRRRVCRVFTRGAASPFALRLGTTDWLVLQEIMGRKEYQDVLSADLGTVRRIVDLGSNIGLSVRLWRDHFTEARVVAVEPDEDNAAVLEENVRLAGQEKFVAVERACVMAYARPVQLQRDAGEWGLTVRDAADSNLKVLTMPELLQKHFPGETVDLLKCDVEGAEAELFENCRAWMPRIRHVKVELHPPYTVGQLEAALQKNGVSYRIVNQRLSGGIPLVLFSNTTACASPQEEVNARP